MILIISLPLLGLLFIQHIFSVYMSLTDFSFFRQSEKYFRRSKDRIGGQYKKARFHQYTDSTFINKTQRQPSENHLGILGPVIRAEVGDKIHVSLLNKLSHPVSLYLEGVTLNKSQDGLWLKEQGSKISYGPQCEKTCLRGFGNNTGADQPAHPCSLISALIIRFSESITCKLATGEISIF